MPPNAAPSEASTPLIIPELVRLDALPGSSPLRWPGTSARAVRAVQQRWNPGLVRWDSHVGPRIHGWKRQRSSRCSQ